MPRINRARGAVGALLGLFVVLGLIVQPVLAQTYRFSVPRSTADVTVNQDGTVTVEYLYVFENDPAADPIDVVDIGIPTRYFEMDSITATINGQPVGSIEDSPYVDPGVAIDLGRNDIQPGDTGELYVRIGTVERMLFRASEQPGDEGYGSFQFRPNFFGSEFVRGRTDMTVTLRLPQGLEPDEPRYFTPEGWPGSDEPESGYDENDRVFYRWNAPNASSSAEYTFGASFPARLVPEGALLVATSSEDGSLLEILCPMAFLVGFLGFIGLTIWGSIAADRKRRLSYLPPRISVEGNGIKRGLTAPEAAILMQQPMDKILTMILFAVVKKGAAQVTSRNPMKIDVNRPLPNDIDLRPYESEFLEAMSEARPADQRRRLQAMMTSMVRSVSEKMRGFSLKETVAYYQDIMSKAWQQVEQANTPEMQMKMFDEAMDWTMLDRRFDDRTRDVFGPRPVIVPTWWGRYDPTFSGGSMARPTSPSVPSGGGRAPEGMSVPNLPGADFAASMVGGMQSFASNVIGDVTAFTGGVTEKTNPAPKPTSTSGRSGGGGGGRSCACACACAGCACACAGGGR